MIKQIYNEIKIKTVPYLIIIVLTFIIAFSCTRITINMANNLSYLLLVSILTMNQIILFFSFSFSFSSNQSKLYIILVSILITFALLYVIYIKRIYDEEMQIIQQLKDKDIIEDVNVSC